MVLFLLSIFTMFVLYLRFFIEQGVIGFNWDSDNGYYLELWVRYIIIGSMILMIGVPNCIIFTLAFVSSNTFIHMHRDNISIKRMQSIEKLGQITDICSDMTAALTESNMHVERIWIGKDILIDHTATKINNSVLVNERVQELFAQGCACNTTGDAENSLPLSKSILQFLSKFNFDCQALRKEHLHPKLIRFLSNSNRTMTSTILNNINDSQTMNPERLHTMGDAFDILDF